MSPVLHPPWPLQLFIPLQSCLAEAESETLVPALELEQPVVVAMVPATKPAMAAERMRTRAGLVIIFSCIDFHLYFTERNRRCARSGMFVGAARETLQVF
jgi:hypothetical protein